MMLVQDGLGVESDRNAMFGKDGRVARPRAHARRVCSAHVRSVHLIRTLPMSCYEITYCKVALKWKADAPPCRLLPLLPLPSMVNHSVGSGMRSVAPGLNATTPGDGFFDCVLLVLTECVQ